MLSYSEGDGIQNCPKCRDVIYEQPLESSDTKKDFCFWCIRRKAKETIRKCFSRKNQSFNLCGAPWSSGLIRQWVHYGAKGPGFKPQWRQNYFLRISRHHHRLILKCYVTITTILQINWIFVNESLPIHLGTSKTKA